MIAVPHFKKYVVEASLCVLQRENTAFKSEAAVNLLLGTAVQESRLHYMKQLGGPAMGFFQIEEPTLNDQYDNFLNFAHNERFKDAVDSLLIPSLNKKGNLISNPCYGAAIARIKYWRDSKPLPDANDIEGLAEYWKRIYNSPEGAGTEQEFVINYKRYILGEKNVS